MKILYIAPRYHTNQVPVMKGWNEKGIIPTFYACSLGVSEIHDYVDFYKMKRSLFTCVYNKLLSLFHAEWARSKKRNNYFPDFFTLLSKMKNLSPEVVIIRGDYRGNAIILFICKILNINNVILYVQNTVEDLIHNGCALDGIFNKLHMKRVVFTPVLYKGLHGEDLTVNNTDHHIYYVPLVCEVSNTAVLPQKNNDSAALRILDVGKYREYKNHFYLVEAIYGLNKSDKGKVKVTIIGELNNREKHYYYKKLKDRIEELELENVIELKSNIPFEKMSQLYDQYDMLVLPSKSDSAPICILEAMAHGLYVAGSVFCGTSYILEQYKCGDTFDIQDPIDLTNIISRAINDRGYVAEMGKKGRMIAKEELSFDKYYAKLKEICAAEFGLEIL